MSLFPAPNPALCVLTCLAVHQDVQHRLARHQLQIRGLLWRFPHVTKVRKMLDSLTFGSVLKRIQSQNKYDVPETFTLFR